MLDGRPEPAPARSGRIADPASSKSTFKARRVAGFIRANLFNVAQWRQAQGEILPADDWAYAFAAVLNLATRGPARINSGLREVVTWPGLDIQTLGRDLRELGFDWDDADLANYRPRWVSEAPDFDKGTWRAYRAVNRRAL